MKIRGYYYFAAGVLIVSSVYVSYARGQSNGAGIPVNIDWMGSFTNCNHPEQFEHRFEIMAYKTCCYAGAGEWPFRTVSRNDRSANELVGWAVLEALRHNNKYRSVAWLALGQAHNPPAQKEILDNKRIAYEYVMANYAAAWKHDDPEQHGGPGQAFKVGGIYRERELKDCVGNDEISSVDVPPGLRMRVCDEQSGNPNDGDGCLDFGPGTHGLGGLNDEVSYVSVYR